MDIVKKILVYVLTLESRLIVAKYKPFVVAVTGSVGKTSTKDAIFDVLKDESRYVRKSEKSLNSEIGLPLTIIGVPNAWKSISSWLKNIFVGLKLIVKKCDYPDTLVLEVGADHPNDIKNVASWLPVDIAVITKISAMPVHVEFFKSPQEVFEEKAQLLKALKKGGTLVLYADLANTLSLQDRVKDKDIRVLTFALENPATARALDFTSSNTGISFTLDLAGDKGAVKIKDVIGKTYVYPLLAASAVAKAKNISMDKIIERLNKYEAPKGRMRLISGLNDSILIDDTYNSSPDAVASAVQTLKETETSGRKIAILGDMLELGKYSSEEHRKVGKILNNVVSEVITVGPRSKYTAEEVLKDGMNESLVHSFDTANDAISYAKTLPKAGDLILIKGSQSIRMERVVQALMKDESLADKVLVRQEREWKERG